jgi:hypothetical protein
MQIIAFVFYVRPVYNFSVNCQACILFPGDSSGGGKAEQNARDMVAQWDISVIDNQWQRLPLASKGGLIQMTGGINIEITLLLVVLAVASVWDVFMTIYGTVTILGSGPLQIAASLLFSALVLTLLLNTKRIMRSLSGLMGGLTKFFWFIAIVYDFFTSWVGNSQLIIGNERNAGQTVILIGLTLLVVSSPILLSELWERKSQISSIS